LYDLGFLKTYSSKKTRTKIQKNIDRIISDVAGCVKTTNNATIIDKRKKIFFFSDELLLWKKYNKIIIINDEYKEGWITL
jgi:hypothetical protein